jgi:hypothetical protein
MGSAPKVVAPPSVQRRIENVDLDTRTLTLPISGFEAIIREGDGYSDRLLLKKNTKTADAVYDYLASLMISLDGKSPVIAHDLLNLYAPDTEYIMVECYKLNYGTTFDFNHTCPACNYEERKGIPLDKLDYKELPPALRKPDPTVEIILPKSGKRAVIGMLTGHKESELVAQNRTTGLDLNKSDEMRLRSLDGAIPTYEEVARLKLADHKALRLAAQQLICGYDSRVRVVCSSCGEAMTFNMFMHPDFLLPTG